MADRAAALLLEKKVPHRRRHRVAAAHPQLDIKVLVQDGVGKADAVFKGFDQANGEVLMIDNPTQMPDPSVIEHIAEPMADESLVPPTQAIATGVLSRGLVRLRRADGVTLTLDAIATPLHADDGSVIGSLTFLGQLAAH